MRDKVTKERVAKLHPRLREECEKIIDSIEAKWPKNMAVRVVQGYRTFEEQQAIYDQGRTKPGKIVTNAKPGSSFHNYGLAIDFAILHDKDGNGNYEELSWSLKEDFNKNGQKDWNEVVTAFELAGWTWGGRWKSIVDNPHFEKTFGKSWRTLLQDRAAGKVKDGYVII